MDILLKLIYTFKNDLMLSTYIPNFDIIIYNLLAVYRSSFEVA